MGLRPETIKFVLDNTAVFKKKMLELGNQGIREGVDTIHKTGKEYFGSLGCYHLSMDKNGEDGAMVYDLEKKINKFKGEFDIVTNFGVSNYIQNYMMVYDNMFRFCKKGGIIINVLPAPGSRWTASHHGNVKFFSSLINMYEFDRVKSHKSMNGVYGRLIMTAIVR